MLGLNNNKQVIKVFSAQGAIGNRKLEMGTLCVADPDMFRAWESDYNQQARNEKTNQLTQFMSTLNKQPIKIYQNRPQSKSQSTVQIMAQQFDEKLVQVHEENHRQSMLIWLGIIILALTLSISLMALANMGGS